MADEPNANAAAPGGQGGVAQGGAGEGGMMTDELLDAVESVLAEDCDYRWVADWITEHFRDHESLDLGSQVGRFTETDGDKFMSRVIDSSLFLSKLIARGVIEARWRLRDPATNQLSVEWFDDGGLDGLARDAVVHTPDGVAFDPWKADLSVEYAMTGQGAR